MKLTKAYAQNNIRLPINLGLSENPLGCSPSVKKVLKNISIKDISCYPETDTLKKDIADWFSLNPQNIVLGTGSEQIIKLIAQTFLKEGDTVLIQRGSFDIFTRESLIAGAKIRFALPAQMISNLNSKIIFLCTPNNPTGEEIEINLLSDIIKNNPKSIIIIDEAIGEFSKSSFMQAAIKSKNCIVLKTFSKAFGLAGIRLGFAVGPKILIDKLDLAQQPFPISSISCKLAQAAIKDRSFLEKTIKFISKERSFLMRQLQKRKIDVSKSVTNNLFLTLPKAKIIITKLNSLGVSVISGSEFPGLKQQGFRIAIKDRRTNKLFIQKLDKALACMKQEKLLPSRKDI